LDRIRGVLSRKFSELIENATISDRASREELLLFCKMHLAIRHIEAEVERDLLVIEIVSLQSCLLKRIISYENLRALPVRFALARRQ